MESKLEQVTDVVTRLAEMIGHSRGYDDQDSVNMDADIQASLTGESGDRMVRALEGIAKRVEGAVAKVCTS